jgi:hypothetical protein
MSFPSIAVPKRTLANTIALLAACFLSASAQAAETTQVYLDNGELNYVGGLTAAANQQAMALLDSLTDKPTVLAIRSKGGPTTAGMELGKLVRKHQLTVKVLEYCFSSCANYVFTAAPQKLVSNFAVVGYHGGLSSTNFEPDAEQKAVFEALPAEQRAAARQQFDDAIKLALAPQMEEERKYFQEIGVQQRITTLGQSLAHTEPDHPNSKSIGWTFSVEDFARLGVKNITVINGPWLPRFLASDKTIRRISPD